MTANPLLKNFERIELFTLITIESNTFVSNKEELSKFQITYLQAIDVVNNIMRIHYSK